jgi:hypothetical protein
LVELFSKKVSIRPIFVPSTNLGMDLFSSPREPPHEDDWMNESNHSYAEKKTKWEKNTFKLVIDEKFVREENHQIVMYSKAKLSSRFAYLTYDENETIKPFLKRWFSDRSIMTYKTMNPYPPPMVCPNDVYNIWTDFDVAISAASMTPIPAANSTEADSLRVYNDLITDLFPTTSDIILDILAQIFQTPTKEPGIALIIKGVSNASKYCFLDFVMQLMGPRKVLETSRLNLGRLEASSQCKIPIIDNRRNSPLLSSIHNLNELITSSHHVRNVEGPYNKTLVNNFCRFIFSTDENTAIATPPPGSQFIVLETSRASLDLDHQSEDYFARFYHHMNSLGGRVAFYRFLMDRKI